MSWKPTLNGLLGVLFRHCARLWLNSDRCHSMGVKVYMQMRDGRDDFSPYLGESYDSLGGFEFRSVRWQLTKYRMTED
ncbi:hypothetical protein TNCV_3826531 [Trichonephila clavipes]|nr:hypothetical protein TNCV_3826531 [Trichonephila clavipes]